MLTDEQAAMIAAAIALQGSPATKIDSAGNVGELGDQIASLATSIYVNIREWNDGREHDELQERAGVVNERIRDRR